MRFIGQPNLLVTEHVYNKITEEFKYVPLCQFNENGIYDTDDEKIINKLKTKFEYIENNQEETKPVDSEEIKKPNKKGSKKNDTK